MNKVLKFNMEPEALTVNEILNNKDFLEVKFKAISTANPNRNGSHFTLESLVKAIPTVRNKPVLGSFSTDTNDFRGHEGDLGYDSELDNFYYDYNFDKAEIPLGVIRDSDQVYIEHNDVDGLDWLYFTCAIWVKYNYRQVKSLLAKKNKKCSVEVNVINSEFTEDGIEIFNDFVFDGITILGDQLETGIADAEMTIMEKIKDSVFQKQQRGLNFAYESLNKIENSSDSGKEDESLNIIPEERRDIEFMKKDDIFAAQDPEKEEEAKEDPKKEEEAKEDPKKEEEAKEDPKKEDPKEEQSCGKGTCAAEEDPKKEEEAKEEDPKKEDPKEEQSCGKCAKEEEAKEDPKKEDPKEEEAKEDPKKAEEAKEEDPKKEDPKEEEACGKGTCSLAEYEALQNKYSELEAKYNKLFSEVQAERADRFAKAAEQFVNADTVVDAETKKEYIAQVTEKCKALEFTEEAEAIKFAKGLIAMYYYEAQVTKMEQEKEKYSFDLNKGVNNNMDNASGNANNSKLKDAIYKLNHLN